jgi:hypothetical protein
MDYKEALKEVQGTLKSGYISIRISYDKDIVLPHKEGIMLLQALEKAEEFNRPYGSSYPEAKQISSDSFTILPVSRKEYERFKIASLLKVQLSEVLDMENNAQ